jgi:hypothetical protein
MKSAIYICPITQNQIILDSCDIKYQLLKNIALMKDAINELTIEMPENNESLNFYISNSIGRVTLIV